MSRIIPLLMACVLLTSGCASTKKAADAASAPAKPSSEANGDKKKGIKAFADVIKDDFVHDEGLFTLHRDGSTLYFEIPNDLLDKELLLVSRVAKTIDKLGYGGQKAATQVVRWQRQDDNVLLRTVSYDNVADADLPIYEAVRASNFEPILASFEIKAHNADTTGVVIDVTNLFVEDVPAIGISNGRRTAYGVRRLDKGRSFVSSAKSFPENIEIRHVLTYDASKAPSNSESNTISLEMNQSMIVLPANPMQPRRCDARVGYFAVSMFDYGSERQKADTRCFITRWRLEPSDPEAYARGELVEPVKPIVYYIDPNTPEKWRPYLKQGIEDWQSAYEHAGFKNAIIAKDPPTAEEDPEFSPEDVRYSVIRYFPSNIQNASGPHVHDPRTGEILESDINWYHNIMNLLRNWYLIQTAAANPEAQAAEFDDAVMGELIRFVSAHEVGHTIGLRHNWISSNSVPVDSLRSPTYTATHGTATSIMDYARFNYVAQPGDGVTRFTPDIGAYDNWAIEWGYRRLTDGSDEDSERATLNEWVKANRAPELLFGREGIRIDPRSQNEDLGDDPVYASDLGVENLKRILAQLRDWTAEEAEDYGDLNELYKQVTGQWNRYAGHVARWVGGYYETFKTSDEAGPVYELINRDQQIEAMDWLDRQVFSTPQWVLDRDVLRRIEGVGALERVRKIQVDAVDMLLDPQRLARMIEAEALFGDAAYSISDMLADTRSAVWRELGTGSVVDPFRRSLQRGHLEALQSLMENEVEELSDRYEGTGFIDIDVSQSDIRAYVRGELDTLQRDIGRALTRTRDRMTTLHLRDMQARIEDVLEGED